MGNLFTRCARTKTKYNYRAEPQTKYKDKVEPHHQQIHGTIHSEGMITIKLEVEVEEEAAEEEIHLKDCYNLTENEKIIINNFLIHDLYEKELKFKRSTAEVDCITDGVKTILEQLMAAVCDKDPLLEISHQYLVGSMAEGTSIVEPDEFDFLVVLRPFSEPGAISYLKKNKGILKDKYSVFNESIDLSLRKSDYVSFNEDREVKFKDYFMSKILRDIISSSPEPLRVETDHGNLTINSTIVCHHGPASVVKLLWKPKSKSFAPLDILIDITPSIEQKGIDKIIDSKDIPDGYKSHTFNDDTFMLIPLYNERILSFNASFDAAFTTTEVNIVNKLSSHHKTSYMILKYCFNSILYEGDPNPYKYLTIFPSYLLKTFTLRHVVRCETEDKGHRDKEECLFTCLLDITDDFKNRVRKSNVPVDGIFGSFKLPMSWSISRLYRAQVINDVIGRLVQIGKEGYSEVQHEYYRKACHTTSSYPVIQKRADRLVRENVECHLSNKCKIHQIYDLRKQ